jgi:hypothetical protein
MLDLTALLTKDSIEPLTLPGMRAVLVAEHSVRFAHRPDPCRFCGARAMIHRNAHRYSVPGFEQDGGAVMVAETVAIDCHALRSKPPKRASAPALTCSG